MISLLVMTDGRADCLARSVASFDRLHGPITSRIIHDDSGDPDYTAHLKATYPGWALYSTGTRSGFAGAYRSAWAWLRIHDRNPLILSTEDDFVVTRDVDLRAMATVLDACPYLVQMALRRQAWNLAEIAAGGIVEQHPDEYTDCHDGVHDWLEHRRFFTTNPSLFRRRLILSHEWPDGPDSEGRFGVKLLLTDPTARSAFWGARDSGEWVQHIGIQRVGKGY
jgi:hypothetical protein